MLAVFFDAMRRYRKEQGRILADLIREYIADGRLVRIAGDSRAQYVPLLKDQITFEYDTIVDEAPTSPNMKNQVFSTLSTIMPMVIKAGIPMPPELLDYTPLPESLAQKWKETIKQASQKPDPAQQQMQMEQAAKQQEREADHAYKMAELAMKERALIRESELKRWEAEQEALTKREVALFEASYKADIAKQQATQREELRPEATH
jgi:hypothetical protein